MLQRSLYLLLFNLKRESEGVHDVKAWLESITYKAPYSSVMIIGTHMDERIAHQNICDGDFLLQQAKMVASVYENKLETIGFLQIGLQYHQDAVAQMLDNIHSCAVNYPFSQLELKRGMCLQITYSNRFCNCMSVHNWSMTHIMYKIVHKSFMHAVNLIYSI